MKIDDLSSWSRRSRTGKMLLNHIETDGTAAGFFELIALYSLGSRFYRLPHWPKEDPPIICTRERLLHCLSNEKNFRWMSDSEHVGLLERAKAIDPEPRIIFDDDRVTIDALWYDESHGLYRRMWELNRVPPHRLAAHDFRIIVPSPPQAMP
jgi:hypothetical protein